LRVVITGASGFIGKPLSKILAEQGFEVLAITRKRQDGESINFLSWLEADLSSPETYQKVIKSFSPEVLIHLAWQDIPDYSLNKSILNLNQSLEFISFITEIKSCHKILISGSCWEYDITQGECNENYIGKPKDYFTLSKHSLRLWLSMIAKDKSISLGWFRLFYVYGPGQKSNSLIPSVLTHLKDGCLPDIKTLYNSSDYIFIDDVVDAFATAVKSKFESGIYNLGTGKSTSVLEVCRIAERIVLNSSSLTKRIEKKSSSSIADVNFWAGVNPSKKHLKWSSKTNLSDGINRTWNYFQSK
jgi:nucleoside-diphosphate-sugar epimerase